MRGRGGTRGATGGEETRSDEMEPDESSLGGLRTSGTLGGLLRLCASRALGCVEDSEIPRNGEALESRDTKLSMLSATVVLAMLGERSCSAVPCVSFHRETVRKLFQYMRRRTKATWYRNTQSRPNVRLMRKKLTTTLFMVLSLDGMEPAWLNMCAENRICKQTA